MKRLLPFIIIALIASGVLGWLRAGTSAGPQPPTADGWEALQYQPPSAGDYQAMAARLKATSLLPLSRIAERKLGNSPEAPTVAGPGNAPPFPKIASSYVINSTRYVQLLGTDKTMQKVKAGDVLENGIEIKSIDRRRVLAVFDGEEIEVPIIAHLQSAFEKSEENAMDDNSPAVKPPSNRSGGGE